MANKKVAVVTGAFRGLGFATGVALAQKGYDVILASRHTDELNKKIQNYKKEGLTIEAFECDVTNQIHISNLVQHIKKNKKHIDVLVNNAGIVGSADESEDRDNLSISNVSTDWVQKAFDVNTLGPYRLCQAFVPLMLANNFGRIVNVSSGMGGLTEMEGYYPDYRISKAALNVITRVWAVELGDKNIKINSVCPGWVKTEMGGPNAERNIDDGIQGIVWAATLPDNGPTGGFFRDGKPIEW